LRHLAVVLDGVAPAVDVEHAGDVVDDPVVAAQLEILGLLLQCREAGLLAEQRDVGIVREFFVARVAALD
jgi:hypothetical protein